MSRLIIIDDGHGMSTAGKRTPIFPDGTKSPETGKNFMHENEFNRAVAKYLDLELKSCGFRTLMVAPTDEDTSLNTRVQRANSSGGDLYVSIHANANTSQWGNWGGTETYTYPKGESLRIGKIIHKHLIMGTPLRDRGVKDGAWLYVIKNTKMPAVLVEVAFMDNLNEAKLLLSDAFRRESAREIAMGICEAYSVKYVGYTQNPKQNSEKPSQRTIYRVRKYWSDPKSQIGAYTNLESAKSLANQNSGYKVFNEEGGILYDPSSIKDDKVWYRVRTSWNDAKSQIGAFHELSGAKELAESRVDDGYKVFDEKGNVVYSPSVKKEQLYRVRTSWNDAKSQIGAFKSLDSAKLLADSHQKDYKVFDIDGNIIYVPLKNTENPKNNENKTGESNNNKNIKDEKDKVKTTNSHSIIGKSNVSYKKLVAFVESKSGKVDDLEDIAKSFIDVGNKYNIKGDIAFCQSIIETGWFKFEGGTAVTPDQHNYCGLGVVSKGVKGNSFKTIKEGVTAQIQHLYAYATSEEIPNDEIIIDPRFKYVSRGIAPNWEDLSNRWAMNPNYGDNIISLYNSLLNFEYDEDEDKNNKQEQDIKDIDNNGSIKDDENDLDNHSQYNLWKKIIDYLFEKLSLFFKRK